MRSLALETIARRNDFYYYNSRQMLWVIGLLFIIIGQLAWFIHIKLAHRAEPVYFPTTPDGRAIHPVDLSLPFVKDEVVQAWAIDAARTIYDFDFVNYARSLENLRSTFTEKGFDDYLKALKQSNNIDAVKVKRQVVSAELNGEVSPIRGGNYKGRYAWQMKVPLKVRYQNANNELLMQEVVASLLIVRMNLLDTQAGIAIHQFIEEAPSP